MAQYGSNSVLVLDPSDRIIATSPSISEALEAFGSKGSIRTVLAQAETLAGEWQVVHIPGTEQSLEICCLGPTLEAGRAFLFRPVRPPSNNDEAVRSAWAMQEAKHVERLSLAKQLHDNTLQTLTAALLELGLVDAADSTLATLTRRAVAAVRIMTAALAPARLGEGLGPALDDLADLYNRQEDRQVDLHVALERTPSRLVKIKAYDFIRSILSAYFRDQGCLASVLIRNLDATLRIVVDLSAASQRNIHEISTLGLDIETLGGSFGLNSVDATTTMIVEFPLNL